MIRARVLVVDDEAGMLRATGRVLAGAYDVALASSGPDALARAAEFQPDVILLDVRMPDVSGFDLVDRLREQSPGADVIFMTGSVNQVDATFVRAIRAKAFYFIQKPFDREVLLALVERCVELRRVSRENREHVRRIEGELAAARAFQRGLLPPFESSFPGVSVVARYLPTAELAGDFFDVAAAEDGRVALLIADVSGHGASAAMLTGVVKAAFDSAHADAHAPLAVVRRIAAGLRGFDWSRFVTLIAARIDPAGGTMEYVGAGHPPALLWSRGRAPEALPSTGMLITPAFPEGGWEPLRAEVRPGDRLLFYTDGVVEAYGPSGQFGRGRLLDVVGRQADGGAGMLDAVLEAVAEHTGGAPPQDDLTLLTASLESRRSPGR